jgi:gliding motility-associated lipoprotein GldH
MNKRVLIFCLFIGLTGVLVLSSCSENEFYQKVYSFSGNEWKQKQKPRFEVQIDDTNALYGFVLTLRTTTEYKYNNLWIFWNTKTPDGQNVREPFELKIVNPDGSWVGKNSGTIVENQISFRPRKVAPKGKYTFVLEQGITQEVIDQVLDVDLTVSKLKDKK